MRETVENIVSEYVNHVQAKLKTGQAREHAYRPVFESMVHSLDPKLHILNDPSRSEHGNPDFVFIRGQLTAGYAETKDIGADLDKVEKTKQMERYLGYSNLILTDYLEFRFYRNGASYGEAIRIAELQGGAVVPNPVAYSQLAGAIKDFLAAPPEKIKNGRRLAEIMGGKARRIRDNASDFLDTGQDSDSDLLRIYESVKKLLLHDLTHESFADMYAQTLVYGLFVARYHDETPDSFSREEARGLVPESNPFLRQFFDHIAGANFNKRLRYIVDELCAVFAAADVRALMEDYITKTGEAEGQDPVIHFYEDFLKEYDPVMRKKMGAYYTPLPVVRFIVRAVDDLLKNAFNLPEGLADASKLSSGQHRVQVLDPAVGTGTFISAVIRIVYERILNSGQKGQWTTYVHRTLLPRIHGFELMMAAYTIAHLKLSIAFKQTGFTAFYRRLGIYLTNSLEPAEMQTELLGLGLGLAHSIAEESKQAEAIKNETPIMVVLGNPPYSISSQNKGDWISQLISEYKKDLNERNIQPLSDDYIKFIRYAEHFIEKNGNGIVAMITNNSFIDGITHRQMRKHLLETFDDIYILDLHGSTKKQETTLDGGKDQNVFNIQQGVSINIFIRKEGHKQGLGKVHHADLYGSRESKFIALSDLNVSSITWQKLQPMMPHYYFIPKNDKLANEYESFINVRALMPFGDAGIKTHRDWFVVDFDRENLRQRIERFVSGEEVADLKDTRDFSVAAAREALRHKNINDLIIPVGYRPFDNRFLCYDDAVADWPRRRTMMQIIGHNNYALALLRNSRTGSVDKHLIVDRAVCKDIVSSLDNALIIPLYKYSEDGTRRANFNEEELRRLAVNLAAPPSPIDTLDYIYAVLHSPLYRKKYREYIKSDFPRVPYPKSKQQFNGLVKLGKQLRELHLFQSSAVNRFITTYPVDGSNLVEKIRYEDGKVYINGTQYFGQVPENAWNFYIGGYQPAQKWLKDRKGRELTDEDINHYQKMTVALVETDKLMKQIDEVGVV